MEIVKRKQLVRTTKKTVKKSKSSPMNKAKVNYVIDILLAISFILVAVTGILKLYICIQPEHLNYTQIRVLVMEFR